ncbi:carnosine synthase 1 [Eudromia elegans]
MGTRWPAPSLAGAPCPAGNQSSPTRRAPSVPRQLSVDQISAEQPLSLKDARRAEAGTPCRGCPCDGPAANPEGAGDADGARDAYELLQSALRQEGLPGTVDHTAEPRTGFGALDVTVCVLGAPGAFLPVLLEGGARCPGAMLLCLSPAWAGRVPSETRPGACSLLLSRAVSFEAGGRSALEAYAPPRRAAYVMGAFTAAWAAELARDLDCPTGGSAPLARLLEDPLAARALLAARAALPVPPTLAFAPPRPAGALPGLPPGSGSAPGLRLVPLGGDGSHDGLVREEVGAFLAGPDMAPYTQVAVRPAGWRWRGSGARSTHAKADEAAVAQAVRGRLHGLREEEEEDSVLVEAVVPTANVPGPGGPTRGVSQGPPMALRICTVLCRAWGERPQLAQVTCSVGRAEAPPPHGAALPQSLDSALQHWGLTEPAQRQALSARLRRAAEAAMAAVLEVEAELSPEQRGGARVHTDVMGVDFLLTCVGDSLELMALSANTLRCLETCWLAEAMGRAVGEPAGALALQLAEIMLHRAQCHLLEGKEILLIEAGGVSKSFVWDVVRDYRLKIHLVEADPEHFAAGLVETFMPYDSTEHRRDEEHAERVVEMVRARGLRPHGCICYWDDCVVLAALVCQRLGLRTSPAAAVSLAKQKSRTHQHLLRCRRGRPPPAAYAVPCCHVESHADVERAAGALPFPAVAKLEFGAGAVGVRLVGSASECHAHAERLWRDLRSDADHPGIGLGWGNSMLLMEYVPGTEHDVDLVIFEGELLGAWVSDNGPTRVPAFVETAACMPSCLPPDRQAQLVRAAHQCCVACGLLDGVFNVELKLGPGGPRLLEINPRMGGFYLRDWIREIYGVDLLVAALMVACGLRPVLPARPVARTFLAGVMCLASVHGPALGAGGSLEALRALQARGLVRLNRLFEHDNPGDYEEPYLSVACGAPTRHDACLRLLSLCQALGIDLPSYPVAHFLSHFK